MYVTNVFTLWLASYHLYLYVSLLHYLQGQKDKVKGKFHSISIIMSSFDHYQIASYSVHVQMNTL